MFNTIHDKIWWKTNKKLERRNKNLIQMLFCVFTFKILALQWCFGPSYFPQDKFFLPSFFKHEWTFICEHVVRTFNNWVSLCSTLIIGTYIHQHELVTLYVRCCTLSLNIFSFSSLKRCVSHKQISHNINTHYCTFL